MHNLLSSAALVPGEEEEGHIRIKEPHLCHVRQRDGEGSRARSSPTTGNQESILIFLFLLWNGIKESITSYKESILNQFPIDSVPDRPNARRKRERERESGMHPIPTMHRPSHRPPSVGDMLTVLLRHIAYSAQVPTHTHTHTHTHRRAHVLSQRGGPHSVCRKRLALYILT